MIRPSTGPSRSVLKTVLTFLRRSATHMGADAALLREAERFLRSRRVPTVDPSFARWEPCVQSLIRISFTQALPVILKGFRNSTWSTERVD